ncbi:MAG: type IV toxin-antitoxin system AbiEi family antitoxin domain-containing protein [Thermoplasmatales archaeon]|nr:type IV toxin-antitoxin system AbiEi family antitoxin domain-containing protein [Candidatus Thermoplasmatota archaeon]MCL6003427.1 type IV toxin-antitoxin system AbiEi family antitoxin domain-containing protein [Candidatus Thermoplasmatota archaeon]MDA8056222.1 type IV toxin-antitoxin system AbiEi family antitoxin domain-containing protein [Thermoplasmatales archaeon]
MTYFDVLKMEFGRRKFSVSDVARITGNDRPRKLLSELKMSGKIRRVGRGIYLIPRPIKKFGSRSAEWERVRDAIFKAPFEKAWAGSTAVEIWTDGAYVTMPNSYLLVYDLLVRNADIGKWKEYLKKHSISYVGNKRVGCYVSLEGTDEIRSVMINGEPVILKDDVVKLIREHPGVYAEAEDLIAY